MAQPGLVRIIYNPLSGRGRADVLVRDLIRHLEGRRFSIDVCPLKNGGSARDLAAEAPDESLCVLSIGGDGTHREVGAGLVGRRIPFAAIPCGTENVLAKTFGFVPTAKAALHTIQNGRRALLDVGACDGRPFLMFAGVGFDAAVTRAVHADRDGPITRAAYYGPMARLLATYPFPRLTVTVDGRTLCDDAATVMLGNTPRYADGLRLCARAVADDGLLDVAAFRTRSRLGFLAMGLRAKLGRHMDHPQVAYARGRRIEVTSAETGVPVQIDGDAVAETPVVFTVRPKSVWLLLPPEMP